jgi:Mrp family chromosome partitioning ATPase
MLPKIINPDFELSSSFDLHTSAGAPAMSFPIKVIDNLRYLVARIQRSQPFPTRLALTSALRGEGVTYLTYALGTTLAHDRPASICIVDLNWHWPFQSPFVDPENPGIAGVCLGEAALDEVITTTGQANLSVLPAGSLSKDQYTFIAGSAGLQNLISQLGQRFDHLIMDLPAVLATSDSVTLAPLSNACCLVIRHGVTADSDARSALDVISHLPVLGTILNQVSFATPTPWIEMLLEKE